MKKIKVKEVTEKKGLFGKKTVVKDKVIKVDNKTYRKMKREEEERDFDKLVFWVEALSDD